MISSSLPSPAGARVRSAVRPIAALLLLLAILAAVLAPSCDLGFVSDDYENLVESTVRLPLTVSFDDLHRPLRNILFKFSYRIFGTHPEPYHVGILLLHLLAVAALYHFTLRCRGGRWAALTAATCYGFFPRNHQVLFWVSAGQDSVVVVCALIAAMAFLRYKQTPRIGALLTVIGMTLLALGFKETAVAIFPLLVLVDCCCGERPLFLDWRKGATIYLPLVILGALYLLWLKGYFSRGGMTQSFYVIQSPEQSLKMVVKFLLNMALPFSSPVEARELLHRLPLFVTLLLEVALGITVGWLYLKPREILLAASWFALTAAPTVVLGFYTDRYLGLPFISMSLLLGFIAEQAVARNRRVMPVLLLFLLCSYSFAAVWRLHTYEKLWRSAAHEVRATMTEVRQKYPQVPQGAVINLVNLTHTIADGQVYVFNGRLNGALWTWGYDQSVTARRTFDLDDSRERQLVQELGRCAGGTPAKSHLIYSFDPTAAATCEEAVIARSQREAPDLWR